MPPEQLPPSLSGAPKPGYSPASTSSGNPGAIAAALSQVSQAVKLLQAITSALPIGSKPQLTVQKCITDLSKIVPSSEQVPGIQKTALSSLNQQQQQQAPMMAMLSSMGRPQGVGGQEQAQ